MQYFNNLKNYASVIKSFIYRKNENFHGYELISNEKMVHAIHQVLTLGIKSKITQTLVSLLNV